MRRLALALVAALAGVAAPVAPAAAAELVVGLNMPSPGFQVGSVRGTDVYFAKGLEIDLARAIGSELGRPVRLYQESSFTRLLAAGPKPWHVALASVTISARRDSRVDFSTPYLRADQGVLRRKGLGAGTSSLAALRSLRICALRGTTAVRVIASKIRPRTEPVLSKSYALMLERLRIGACDVAIDDLPTLAMLRAEWPNRFGAIAGRIVTNERYGVVLPEGATRLRLRVDAALGRLAANGRLARITRRWLELDPAAVPRLR